MLHLVIMAGGSGTRLWPESRRNRPKQLLTLIGERSFLRQATDRGRGLVDLEHTWVVTSRGLERQTRSELPELPTAQLLLEPTERNTAACVGLAATRILRQDPEATLLVTPADHLIRPEALFRQTITEALKLLEDVPDATVLLGVPPRHASSSFGYIVADRSANPSRETALPVVKFVEKPAHAAALSLLEAGDCFWNSGIFLWKARRVIELIHSYLPKLAEGLRRLDDIGDGAEFETALEQEYASLSSISIDHGLVMPLAEARGAHAQIFVVPAAFDWHDVGNWQAQLELATTDSDGNSTSGLVITTETQDCVVRSTTDHVVAVAGLTQIVVVHTDDATLVAPLHDEQALRRLSQLLEERGLGRFL